MRIPYFRAKDKDSNQWVQGFYAEFPMYINQKCELIPAIVMTCIDPDIENMMNIVTGVNLVSVTEEPQPITGKVKNTLSFCTIDKDTLQQIGEIDTEVNIFDEQTYIKIKEQGKND